MSLSQVCAAAERAIMHARSLFGPVGGVAVPEGSSAAIQRATGARNLTTDMKIAGKSAAECLIDEADD